ncbi:hypothetical protein SMY59_002713 [Cronobacter sakazakii]|uniref:hypothetical protein n=1 Tax=Cronobacter sakazakii TaxID=28141 RepID=UPI000CF02413|nr:hypothetical protein [Cronobacter sakazakii]ELY2632450.1 hypothetical protein [Cronobacter sakazakii]ELY4115256.1 hypothetical protein [Cronobacter sakazakii]ELY4201862.1 hypothetical protein [Cronobacter sakazakii]ELY5948101.1 hypothetical protein [Cronobacter sakazakii]MDT3632761.1 hypothetical protein [Cronobacter sakazakii]
MKLIDLLVQELPKRGGWPEGVYHAWCDPDGEIRFRNGSCKPDFYPESEVDIQYRVPNSSHEDDPLYIVTPEQYEAALAAAQQPVWDGEGLPPVGCECEFFDCEKWFKVTMMYGGSQLVVLYDHDNQIERSFSTSRIDGKFRPIRSEAEGKRAAGVTALAKAGGNIDFEYGRRTIDGELSSPGWYELYDAIAAGKIPHIRIE